MLLGVCNNGQVALTKLAADRTKQTNSHMKLATKILTVAIASVALLGKPAIAGDVVVDKKKVVIEEESRKWWGAALSTGWDSLYMFRGVNVLPVNNYGSGIYWTDLSATWNITDNDFLTAGTWVAFGTQKTNYKELDVYTSYTHTFGDFALSFGYIFYYVWASPLYSHELNVKGAYTFNLPAGITITPSLTYYFNIGPDTDDQGIAPQPSSYLLARIDAGIPLYKDIVSLAPWVSFGSNFRYNAKVDGDGNLDFFNGANDLQVGVGLPVKINDVISLYGYGAYSYQWYGLVGTEPSTFWGGAKVTFSF